MKITSESIALAYLGVKKFIIQNGYDDEIEWQYNIDFYHLDEETFLREYSWVVLNTGMKEKTIKKIFPSISSSFLFWQSSQEIVDCKNNCKNNALGYFNNEKKINAIIDTAAIISKDGFQSIYTAICNEGIDYLQNLPFIGPITSFHLAKNIGFSVAKPDRHLVKIMKELNYSSVEALCSEISELTDDPIPVVDIVLWRYSTLRNDFIGLCKSKDVRYV
ncbi:hypothetical protein FACS189468_1230 [Spirochaetia bacterium]|nr:hypothetical protein FACS189468_1230 [Spirochaetia bacterium]